MLMVRIDQGGVGAASQALDDAQGVAGAPAPPWSMRTVGMTRTGS